MCLQEPSKGMCFKSSVGYIYSCNRCEQKRKEEIDTGTPIEDTTEYRYVGETSRTAYTRHLQHLQKYRSKERNQDKRQPAQDQEDDGSGTFMWSHTRDCHGGSLGQEDGSKDYKLEIEGTFRDTMSRQIDEDVRMRGRGWGEDCMTRQRRDIPAAPKCVLMNGKSEYFKPKSIQTIFKQW